MLNLNKTKSQARKAKQALSPIIMASVLTLGLSACDDDDDKTPVAEEMMAEEMMVTETPVEMAMDTPVEVAMEYSYDITVTNLTYAQPLSPITALLHGDAKLWEIGETATVALEKLAEAGDNSDLISLSSTLASSASEAPLGPGASVTVSISSDDEMAKYFTVATMLVNTNDAFSGLTGVDISTLTVDQAQTWYLNVYDAGTEANTEAAGTIPGPADGGTGFDAAREDSNLVAYHAGVVSQDDGLSSSVLTQAHRFDNPAVKVTITRTK